MKFIILLSILLVSSFSDASIKSKERNSHEYQILAHEDLGSEIKQQDFYFIASTVTQLYQKEARRQGRTMVIATLDWETPYFSAWAKYEEKNNTYQVNFWGGFARLPDMTKRAFVFTACHEVGHLLGEYPRIKIKGMQHMSTEGQSDFFAANSCYKKFVTKYPKYFDAPLELNPYAASLCEEKFLEDKLNKRLCFETMQVARDFTLAINYVNNDVLPQFHTPDNLVVKETKDSYPSMQCRMDIIVNSALMPYESGKIGENALSKRLPCWFANTDT